MSDEVLCYKIHSVFVYSITYNELICKVYTGEFHPKQEQTITIDFTMFEHATDVDKKSSVLKRSKRIN